MRVSHPISLSYFTMISNNPLIFALLYSTLPYFIHINLIKFQITAATNIAFIKHVHPVSILFHVLQDSGIYE